MKRYSTTRIDEDEEQEEGCEPSNERPPNNDVVVLIFLSCNQLILTLPLKKEELYKLHITHSET